MFTGTLEQKIGSSKSVPVHHYCVPVHLYENYGNCLGFDPNVRAHLSINLGCEITLERGIKTTGYKEKAAFDF